MFAAILLASSFVSNFIAAQALPQRKKPQQVSCWG
jgi:hypothetical protein